MAISASEHLSDDEFLENIAREFLQTRESAQRQRKESITALVQEVSRRPHLRVEYRVGWASLMLAFLLGVSLCALALLTEIPGWLDKGVRIIENQSLTSTQKEEPRRKRINDAYEQAAIRLGLRK